MRMVILLLLVTSFHSILAEEPGSIQRKLTQHFNLLFEFHFPDFNSLSGLFDITNNIVWSRYEEVEMEYFFSEEGDSKCIALVQIIFLTNQN